MSDGEDSPATGKSYITRGKLNPDKEAAEKRNKKNSLRRVTKQPFSLSLNRILTTLFVFVPGVPDSEEVIYHSHHRRKKVLR